MRAWSLVWSLLVLVAALPSVAQAPGTGPSPLARDARLGKSVTVRWDKVPLAEALRELATVTGARMNADRGVADEPVMAAIKAAPAHLVMDQLATLLHYTWVKTGGTPEAPVYQIRQSAAQRKEEQDEIDRGEREVIAALEKELENYRRLSRLPPEQLDRELEKAEQELEQMFAGGNMMAMANDPQAGMRMMNSMAMRAVASPLGRTMLDLLDGLGPQQWETLREEGSLSFSTSPGGGERPLPAGMGDRIRSAKPEFPFPKTLFRTFAPGADSGLAQVEQLMADRWSKATEFKVNIQLTLNMGSAPLGMLRAAPEPSGGEEGPAGAAMNPVFGLSGLMVMGIPDRLAEMEEADPERDRQLSEDPLLGKKAILKLPPPPKRSGLFAMFTGAYRMAEVLPAVEETFGVKLLSDAYSRQAMTPFTPPGEAEIALFKVLDKLAGTGRRWERDGDLIRFKSKTWAHDRRAEIPARLVREWQATREKQGGFTIDQLARMALLLRDEQLESLLFSSLDNAMAGLMDGMVISSNRGILRLYGSLPAPQRQRLLGGGPLAVRALALPLQAYLLKMNRAQNQSMFSIAFGVKPNRRPEELADAVLTLERKGTGDQSERPPRPTGPGEAFEDFELPTAIYTFRLAYVNNQKDEYMLMVSEPKKTTPPVRERRRR